MPGQKAQAVRILGGHLMLPLGPVKLAQISGEPDCSGHRDSDVGGTLPDFY